MLNLRQSLAALAFLAASGLTPLVIAHPGESHEALAAEMTKRDLFMRDQAHLRKRCASHFATRGHAERAVERRRSLVEKLREERGIAVTPGHYHKRDLTTVLDTDHNLTLIDTDVTITTSQDDVFGDNTSCILWPQGELMEGPYYVRDELIRQNGIEDQPGFNMTLDVQVIDINTCEPVANQWTEFWQANQTGVYSGTTNTDNGDGTDPSILNTTFSRAIWPTDDEGVVQVQLPFPGHYAPRATHTHVIVHQNATKLANGTLLWGGSGTIDHVGQVFFDQDLIDDADLIYPYTTNPNAIKLNSQDAVLASEAEAVDPVTWYVQLGESLADGIVAWVTLGVDTTASYEVEYAATWTANGGVENPDAPQP